MIKSVAGYHIAVIDPNREADPLNDTGEYRYAPFALLSHIGLSAVTAKAGDTGGTTLDTTETDILENGTPPGDGTGFPVGEFTTQADADEYLATGTDSERITFPRTTLSVTIDSNDNGVVVDGTECFGIWYNKTRDVSGVFGAAGSHAILYNSGFGDWSLNAASFAGSPTLQPGDEIEYFLASTAALSAAGITSTADLDDTSLSAANLERFSVDSGSGYFWLYSNTFVATNSDFENLNADPSDSGDGGSAFKALKPKAATNSFTFNLTVQNPDTSAPGLGIEVQITNVTKGLTQPASYQILDVNGQLSVSFSDLVNFVADEGDVISFSLREYLGGPSVSFVDPSIVLATADIVAGEKDVTIDLSAPFVLDIEDVKVLGSTFLAPADGGGAVGLNQVDVLLSLENTLVPVGPIEATVEGTAFVTGHVFTSANIPYTADSSISVQIARFGTTTPLVAFHPVNQPGDVDTSIETIIFDDTTLSPGARLTRFASLVQRLSGILTVVADYDLTDAPSGLDYDGLELEESVINDIDNFMVFGDIINGGPAVINDGDLSIEIKIVGESDDVTSLLTNTDLDTNLEYSETVGVTASGWARNVQEGDQLSIKIFDTSSTSIIPITSATVGAVQLDGTLRVTITAGMITAQTIVPPDGDNNITLAIEYGAAVNTQQVRFHGFVYQPSGFPDTIPGSAKISILNKTKGTSASAVALIDENGEYDITVGDGSSSIVASAGDVIHFTVFQDLAPNAVPYPQNPPTNDFVGAHDPGEDLLLAVQVSSFSDASIVDPDDSSNIVVEVVLQSSQVTSEVVEQSFVLEDVFTPVIADEVEVQSKIIDTGTSLPLRILPYIDVEFPTNADGGVPYEFQLFVSNNANDTVPRFDEVTSLPDPLPEGKRVGQSSVSPLRLHVFSDTTKTAATYGIAIKLRMKRNDATGNFRLHSYGARWWLRE